MSNEQNEYEDFIAFLDDDDKKRELWVQILEIGPMVRFKLKTGKIFSIPSHRILKVKQEGDE